MQVEWATVPPFPGDCLLNVEIQIAGGDWTAPVDSFTSASPIDSALRPLGPGTYDARARVECSGSPCGGWIVVLGVEVT